MDTLVHFNKIEAGFSYKHSVKGGWGVARNEREGRRERERDGHISMNVYRESKRGRGRERESIGGLNIVFSHCRSPLVRTVGKVNENNVFRCFST